MMRNSFLPYSPFKKRFFQKRNIVNNISHIINRPKSRIKKMSNGLALNQTIVCLKNNVLVV